MNDKSMTLVYRVILVCRFQNNQDSSGNLPMRAAICNPKWPTLIKIFNMKNYLYSNQDPYYILPKETAICNLKWLTLKNRILHIILNKVHRNEFGKYSLIY